MPLLRPLVTLFVLLALWEAAARLSGIPAFLLPAPSQVLVALAQQWRDLALHAAYTGAAMLVGLAGGVVLGLAAALALIASATARRWLLPLLVLSQAVPVFALAPLLVLWLGFDLSSKIAMVTLATFFPIALAGFDGMRRTDAGLLDLARLGGATHAQEIRYLRLPAALPALASGLRGAAAVAPIGAIIGEWVGAAAGLGFVMVQTNARMQTDAMFAALVVLLGMAASLWTLVDVATRRALPWAEESVPGR